MSSSPSTESGDEMVESGPEALDEAEPGPSTENVELSTYVVDDLEQKIRESFRPRKSDGGETVPDPKLLVELEQNAKAVAANFDVLLRDLRGRLHGMSDVTLESAQCFRDSISSSCEVADANIRATYAMIAKSEEVSESLRGAQKLATQIKEMRRMVETFEKLFQGSL
ncbi:unnamed protein product, partial [Mesorhabditis spiculigera]